MKPKVFLVSIFLIFWICGVVYSQNPKAEILCQDFSGVFDNLSMIGILGEECSRIDIHFTKIQKVDHNKYTIKGCSRIRLSVICPFEGSIYVDSVSCCFQMAESEYIGVGGFIYGSYCFVEYGDKQYSNVFFGSFKQGYQIKERLIEKGQNVIVEQKLNMAEYRGKWKSVEGLTKVCSWADEVIPDTPTNFYLFNDAGEWIVSTEYRKNGWDNLFNAYHNENLPTDEIQKARKLEEQEWWIDKR